MARMSLRTSDPVRVGRYRLTARLGSGGMGVVYLGADQDGAHTRKEILATARAYGTEAEFFPDMGHNMMLEPGWAAVAERIDSWLGTHAL